MIVSMARVLAGAMALMATGCAGSQGAAGTVHESASANTFAGRAGPAASAPKLDRTEFNRLAVQMDLPLFWAADEKNPGALDPEELVVLGVGFDRTMYVAQKGAFTARFERIKAGMIERRRMDALAAELDRGRPTLIHTDMSSASGQDRAIVRHITAAARIVEQLHSMQLGSHHLHSHMRPGDALGQAVFRRNQGPWCQAPGSESDPFCNACPDFPSELSGMYPPELQEDEKFCGKFSEMPDATRLLDPFTVVRRSSDGKGLVAVPYNEHYADLMGQVAGELRACAAAIEEGEQAFKSYLLAAARAFETNVWGPADEAWIAMNATNSKWYLRIAPDEVYFEPCNRKAGFHVSFARIDPDSFYWQERLTPLRDEMEKRLAELIGPPYQARQVDVHMPDFIAIVLNAGDSRHSLGATIGQSLPNWGAVAEEGRGRTVVMSNLYTDPDSRATSRAVAESLLSPESLAYYTEDKRLGLLDIVLHEATHNFGPHSDYKIDGKRPGDVFGGATATVLEELKAQTGALYFVDLLRQHGVLDDEQARKVNLHSIIWAFGHISRGMFDANGRPKPYSQVAGIQVGFLVTEGVIEWQADRPAANGQDQGRFHVDFEKFAPAVEKLIQQVGCIKATGDTAAAGALIDHFVTGADSGLMRQKDVADRVLRFPKASFVYSVTL